MHRFLFFATFTSLLAAEIVEDTSDITPAVPRLRAREIYKAVLENGLQLYLISDPFAEESAAALSVEAGSWQDPDEFPGLAHYVEHMLFMGTATHPDEFFFTQFLKENSGYSNAFTEDLHTTYLFSVSSSAFPEALSHFSEFFHEPLLKASAMEREIHAITQEFQGSLNSDFARRMMVYKALGNLQHPFSHFNFGSESTLRNAKSDDLSKWIKRYYSSDKMLLVMISPLPLEELAHLAEKQFGSLPKREMENQELPLDLFSEEARGAIVYTKSIQEITNLTFSWELSSSLSSSLEEKPEAFLCYILGYKGGGSLLDLLKREELAVEINCGLERWSNKKQLFFVELDLTEKGAKNPYAIISYLFQAIDFLKTHPLPPSLYNEVKEIARLNALFPQQEHPFNELYTHSKRLQSEALSSYPRKTVLIEQFNPETFRRLLNELTPERLLINLTSQNGEISYDREEPWMHVPFKLLPLDFSKIEKTDNLIRYPEANPYLPQTLESQSPKEESEVDLLFDSHQIKLFGREGNRFETAEIYWSFLFSSPALSFEESKHAALIDLWIQLFENLFQESSHIAAISGLKTSWTASELGLKLTLSGFREHSLLFLKKLLTFASNLNPTEELFEREKETLLQSLRNKRVDSPYKQAFEILKEALITPFVTSDEKMRALIPLTLNDFKTFHKELFSTLSVKAVSIGDQTHKEQEELFTLLKETLPETDSTKPLERAALILPKERGPFLIQQASESIGSALLLAIEDAEGSFEHYASELLLSRIIADPFFQTLRTKQQTAYLIDNSMELVDNLLLNIFILESHSYDPRDLLARVELFLEEFAPSEELFDLTKLSLVNELNQKPLSLAEEGTVLSDLLFLRKGDFSFLKKLKEAMEALTFSTFQEISSSLFSAENRRRLAILIYGKEEGSRGPKYETIESLKEAIFSKREEKSHHPKE